jgi:hypothetical protein
MVARCADVHMRPESVLATLVRDANLLRQWRPGTLTLSQAIAALPNAYVEAFPEETLARSLRSSAEVMTAVPEDLKPEADDVGLEDAMSSYVRSSLDDYRAPLNRYIAAKAFASWTAYQGRGVKTIVRGLEAAYDVALVEAARQCRDAARRLDADLLKEAFRRADFVLNHLAVGEDLAKVWSSVEA